ncbi:hypothetical protein [Antrihabitans sp. YC2-6]|uniref:hypothetical protein n=1 Tax=Antrihabitans sp. YC2-6 TaxID=2799498 RepID=UPI0018F7C0DA|nr:hypothetical protein [Antrihabitans sp. YC2-6]MBJ8346494.1 hypothetical protein [Antrihabitans sp. YC2-6]
MAPDNAKRTPVKPTATKPRALVVAVAVLSVLIVVMTIAAAAFYAKYRTASDKNDAAVAAEGARREACLYAARLVSFDYRSLDTYFTRIADGASGDWKANFESSIAQTRDSLTASRSVASAGDVQCGLVEGDESSATVVIVAAQSIVSGDPPSAPSNSQVYMVAMMVNDGGKWFCDKLVTSLNGG